MPSVLQRLIAVSIKLHEFHCTLKPKEACAIIVLIIDGVVVQTKDHSDANPFSNLFTQLHL